MKQRPTGRQSSSEKIIRDIKRRTRKQYNAEEKIRERYFISESSVYRLLKAHDLITSPAFIVIKAAREFKDKTTAINQMWQTDFTYLKIIGWGWMYLSTILDDFSRYVEESHIAGALLFTG